MEALVEYVAKSLVDDPTQVKVRKRETNTTIFIDLKVAQHDTGRIIGKSGRVANAIRALIQTAESEPRAKRVILKIN